jgi:hypothetical protein
MMIKDVTAKDLTQRRNDAKIQNKKKPLRLIGIKLRKNYASFPHQVANLTLSKKPVNPLKWVAFNLF